MTDKDKQIIEQMKKNFTPEELLSLMEITYTMGVLTAIRDTHSMNSFTLAQHLYNIKGQVIPVEDFEAVVNMILPVVIAEGMVDQEGNIPASVMLILAEYDMVLNGKTSSMN